MERGGSGKQIGNWKGERGEEGREKTRRKEQREEGECVKKMYIRNLTLLMSSVLP